MSEAGFLSAIRAAPDEEPTRLIYADYLEERDDPRGELLRLDARLAEPDLSCAEFDALRDRAKRVRDALSTKNRKWLSVVDAPDRFTVLWTNYDFDRLRAAGRVGKPLRFVSLRDFGQFKVQPGIYVYGVRMHQKKLYVVGRLRVTGTTTRAAYVEANPADAPLIFAFHKVVLLGERGTSFQPDTVVPPEILERFRCRTNEKEYPLKHVKDGQLTHPIDLTGVTRITKPTAQDLDFLLSRIVPRHQPV